MMKYFTTVITISALIFTTVSCGKYEEGPNLSLKTKKARLTNKWVVDEMFLDGVELSVSVPEIDGFTEIKKNGDYRIYYEDRYVTWDNIGTWEFYDSKKKLIVTFDTDSDILTILKLVETELWVSERTGLGVLETRYRPH
ncbi:MAG: hypothetical protein JKY52_03550 [Flavobacteriales bacterium]|nr:hypothetical protein [Flavobacteriales bacterium]